jgi:polyphosphate glucokinase
MPRSPRSPTKTHTLSLDIGGSGLKAAVLDHQGHMLGDRNRVTTPLGKPPEAYLKALQRAVRALPPFHRIAVGFPGVVRDGLVLTAPNLGHAAWARFPLADHLTRLFHAPTRLANDADVQGLAVIHGQGLEMVVTLGTGFGTALYLHGRLCPHLEISQMPFRKGQNFDQQVGNDARRAVGNKRWNERVRKALLLLHTLTHFDRLYLGGGNTKHLRLPPREDWELVPNVAGLLGGFHLWKDA